MPLLSKGFRHRAKLSDHFLRHGADCGTGSEEDYEKKADAFLKGTSTPATQTCVRPRGDILRYDAATGEYGDLFKAGVVDAAKVTRSALQNAASIAALFLTTECIIADKPEKEKMPAMPGGGDMDF